MLRVTAAEVANADLDVNESELRLSLETDLQKLMEEAEMPDGDVRSKRVYASLDEWLKTMLKAVVRPKRNSSSQ
jgi:hypothetical protein